MTDLFPFDLKIDERPGIPATNLYIETTYPDALNGAPQDGKPVIILLPGGPGGGMSIYKKHSQELADFAHLVYWDPRGCGKSAPGSIETYNMNTYIEDVEAIRKKLHLTSLIVLGTSYGSMCALGYAIRYPDHLSALVLGSPVASYHFFESAKKNLLQCGSDEQKFWGLRLLKGELETEEEVMTFFEILAPLYSDLAKQKGVDSTYFKFAKGSYNWEALVEGFKQGGFLQTFDYRSYLKNIIVPTLIMTGRHDWVNDVSLVEEVARNIKLSQLFIFECGHSFACDCHAEYIQTVRSFIGA